MFWSDITGTLLILHMYNSANIRHNIPASTKDQGLLFRFSLIFNDIQCHSGDRNGVMQFYNAVKLPQRLGLDSLAVYSMTSVVVLKLGTLICLWSSTNESRPKD